MTDLWDQTCTNDSYGMGSKYYWGGQFTDSAFHSLSFDHVEFNVNASGNYTKTIGLYQFGSGSTASGGVLLESKSFSGGSGANTWSWSDFGTATFSSTGGYLAIFDGSTLSGFDFLEANSGCTPSSTLVKTVQSVSNTSAWNVYPTEYPQGKMTVSAPSPSSSGTLLPPAPAFVRF